MKNAKSSIRWASRAPSGGATAFCETPSGENGRPVEMQVVAVERKTPVLTPPRLACLAKIPTVNLTAGCAHECRYCYARGYLILLRKVRAIYNE